MGECVSRLDTGVRITTRMVASPHLSFTVSPFDNERGAYENNLLAQNNLVFPVDNAYYRSMD